jgi:hypothetical protein
MKLTTILFSLALFAFDANSQTYSFVISPVQSAADAKTQVQTILQKAANLPAGENIIIMDGRSGESIAQLQSHGPKRVRAFKRKNGENISKLLTFAKAARLMPGRIKRSLHIPRIVPELAQLSNDNQMHVILLGAPLFDEPQESGTSMAGGLIPSDEHLNASRAANPFGLKGQENWLKGIRIHWQFPRHNAFMNKAHTYAIHRFWTLYIEGMGGALVSFGGELETLLKRASKDAKALPYSFERSPTQKKTMMRIEPSNGPTIHNQPVSQATTSLELKRVANVAIGIRWDCACDVDLWAKAHKDALPLYYGRNQTVEGQHIKDIRNAPQSTGGFESVVFKQVIDLQQLRLVANLYKGSAPQGVTGEVRITVNNRTYAANFHIQATQGNKGQDVNSALSKGRTVNQHSVMLNPLFIVAGTQGASL